MIIKREQQEKILDEYMKEKRTTDELIGFVDGVNATLDLVNKEMLKDKSLPCVVCNGSGKR